MRIFDIGFYDGSDTDYYLWKGAQVVAFEANPVFAKSGAERFSSQIDSGQLLLNACGVGVQEGVLDFFLNRVNAEWSTFYREAAINWGEDAYDVVQVPCITAAQLFDQHGVPDYLKVDIEGYDIHIARALRQLDRIPGLASFEASNRAILRELLLAGYDSFKLVDQGKVPAQIDEAENGTYRFTVSNTGMFGDAAPGEWLSFENALYLYLRFEGDEFGTSVPAGSWWDIHAATGRQAEMARQLDYMRDFIERVYDAHCGLEGKGKPHCPAHGAAALRRQLDTAERRVCDLDLAVQSLQDKNTQLRDELDAVYGSTSWRITAPVRALRRALER